MNSLRDVIRSLTLCWIIVANFVFTNNIRAVTFEVDSSVFAYSPIQEPTNNAGDVLLMDVSGKDIQGEIGIFSINQVKICNAKDNNCDGVIPVDKINADKAGYREFNGDCNNADPNLYTEVPELGDGKINEDIDHAYSKPLGILIPAYFYPSWRDPNENFWDDLARAAARVPIIAIVNPNSGPDTRKNPDYELAIKRINDAGGKVIGYVHTSYGDRDLANCKAEVDAYYNWYHTDGIFFDEMSYFSNNIKYYEILYSYVTTQYPEFIVVGNPGMNTIEGYQKVSTILNIFEGTNEYSKWVNDDWITKYPRTSFCNLIYGIPDKTIMEGYIDSAISKNIGWIYITDDNLPNPWDTLPLYWNQEVDYINAIRCTTE